jgi:hypothetical protein
VLQFGLDAINLAYEQNISNIAIIGLWLWADETLFPQQRQAFFVMLNAINDRANINTRQKPTYPQTDLDKNCNFAIWI